MLETSNQDYVKALTILKRMPLSPKRYEPAFEHINTFSGGHFQIQHFFPMFKGQFCPELGPKVRKYAWLLYFITLNVKNDTFTKLSGDILHFSQFRKNELPYPLTASTNNIPLSYFLFEVMHFHLIS